MITLQCRFVAMARSAPYVSFSKFNAYAQNSMWSVFRKEENCSRSQFAKLSDVSGL